MKLKDIRDSYYTHTASASSVSRQVSFAGIALIWIFKTQYGNSIILPNDLLLPALLLTMSLTSDLLQYISSSAIWGIFNRINEIKHGADFEGDIKTSKFLNWPAIFFFWLKLLLSISGYLFIFLYLYKNINFI